MLSKIKTAKIDIDGQQVDVRGMSAACFIEQEEARGEGKSQIYVAAIVAKHCCEALKDESLDDIVANETVETLQLIMTKAVDLSGFGSKN